MSNDKPLIAHSYEIVKYNLRTREDLEVLPNRIQGLAEVNKKIEALNTRLRASKKDEGGDIVYYRRKV